MEVLDHFSIPFIGLNIGLHHLKFKIDNTFFTEFEDSIVKIGEVEVLLDFDKKSTLSTLDFHIEGTVMVDCDRCMEPIPLPIRGSHRLHAKYSDDKQESTDEVVYISSNQSVWNVAQYIYEYIHLSIPMIKTYDCESDPNANCNEKVLARLSDDTYDDEDSTNPMWDTLNDLNLDQ